MKHILEYILENLEKAEKSKALESLRILNEIYNPDEPESSLIIAISKVYNSILKETLPLIQKKSKTKEYESFRNYAGIMDQAIRITTDICEEMRSFYFNCSYTEVRLPSGAKTQLSDEDKRILDILIERIKTAPLTEQYRSKYHGRRFDDEGFQLLSGSIRAKIQKIYQITESLDEIIKFDMKEVYRKANSLIMTLNYLKDIEKKVRNLK